MTSLAERYDALFVDLDGVVYRGDRPVPDAGAVLDEVRGLGLRLLFLTNNSSRTPDEVARKIQGLGVRAGPEEVLTSSLATAALLRKEGQSGVTAFVIGERGILAALEGVGIHVLDGEPQAADLVVVGWDRSVDYAKLRTAALLVQRGARLIATNADASYPAPDGLWPGAGAILSAVTTTTGAAPTIVGKPARPLFEAALDVTGAARPLVVGDRLDTDVTGAATVGWDSLLVLTGVAGPADLPRARDLPTYVGRDLSILVADPGPPPARFHPARPSDAAGIAELLAAHGLSTAGLEARLHDTLVCHDDRSANAGSESGVPAATACVERLGDTVLLRSVAVRKDLQNFGLGMLAVAAAAAHARRFRPARFALFTQTAARFFGRMGFRPVDRQELPPSVMGSAQAVEECSASATAMVLDIEEDQSSGP